MSGSTLGIGLKNTFISSSAFDSGNVSLDDYGIMETANACALIITPGGVSIERHTYGESWARTWDLDVEAYVKYAGDWFLPPEERAIAETLVSTYDVDILTQQTDSGSTLDVAVEQGVWFVGKDMDIVGE